MKNVIGIDPGNIESAISVYDGTRIVYCAKLPNAEVFESVLKQYIESSLTAKVYLEGIFSYGMPVGDDVFQTCYFIGRLQLLFEQNGIPYEMVRRTEIKMHFCGATRAKDTNVTIALVNRFDPSRSFGKYGKGTIKNKGFFFGMVDDMWSAFAIALYGYDKLNGR